MEESKTNRVSNIQLAIRCETVFSCEAQPLFMGCWKNSAWLQFQTWLSL